MELHDHLYALGLRLGRAVFDDPDSFRGALDDYLDEDAASTGDINLLVDAVRLGAFRSMVTMLDSGADVSRAVEEAGSRLARDRGSADVAGSQWACAVLGFAIGKVGDADVRRYRTQAPSAGTANRPVPAEPTLPPLTSNPSNPSNPWSQPSEPAPSFQPPYQPQQYGAPQQSLQPPWGGGPPRDKRKVWPIVVAVAAVLAVIVGVGVAVVLGGGDDGPPEGGPSSGPSSETLDATDFEAINQRYSGLGTAVTTGVDECEDADVETGETEKLSCSFNDGTLTLVTYDSADSLQTARGTAVDLSQKGGLYLMTGSDVVYGFDASANEDDTVSESSLYWDDDHAFQTATLTAGEQDVTIDDLKRVFDSASTSLPYPRMPTDADLILFISRLSDSGTCKRIATLTKGETEENSCKAPKGIKVYYGKWQKKSDMKDYRASRDQNTRDSDGEPTTWHLNSAENVEIGTLDQYLVDKGTDSEQAVIYWDDTDCLCYGEAYLSGSNQEKLYKWWQNTG